MGSIPMPFFATRGAALYTERVRAEKERKPQQPDVPIPLDNVRNGNFTVFYLNWIILINKILFEFRSRSAKIQQQTNE